MRRGAVLALLAVTACGSTVQIRGTASLGGDATTQSQGAIGAADGSVGQGGQAPAGTTGGAAVPRGSRLAPGGTSSQPPTAIQPGAVAGPAGGAILVGVPYIDAGESNAFVNSLGNGLATGDTRAAIEARVAEVNRQGGILGRKVVAYYQRVDPTSSPGTYQQAACAAFTQDHKVQYVFDLGLGDIFLTCLAKAHVGVISTGNALKTRAGFRKFPGYFQPNAMALDRIAENQAAQFQAMGFYGDLKTTKVGILYYDQSEFRAAEAVLERELGKRGISVVARQAIRYVDSEDAAAAAVSQAGNTVLKFRSAGVTHVLAVEENAWLTGGFGIAAASQSYYPRYGYTSNEPLGNVAANVPARALRGALFLGWDPVYDVPSSKAVTPAGQACLKYFSHEPQDTPNQRAALVTGCESVSFLQAALTAAGRSEGASSLIDGVSRLKGYASGYTFAVRLSSTQQDGVGAFRPGRWDEGCGCFAYAGGPRRV
jgi:ABC-type branched-subunit amino acid transport system substrate-binding protein